MSVPAAVAFRSRVRWTAADFGRERLALVARLNALWPATALYTAELRDRLATVESAMAAAEAERDMAAWRRAAAEYERQVKAAGKMAEAERLKQAASPTGATA